MIVGRYIYYIYIYWRNMNVKRVINTNPWLTVAGYTYVDSPPVKKNPLSFFWCCSFRGYPACVSICAGYELHAHNRAKRPLYSNLSLLLLVGIPTVPIVCVGGKEGRSYEMAHGVT